MPLLMKKLKTSQYILLLVVLFSFFYSCNNDDLNQITSIFLDADKKQVLVDEVINFTVKADNLTDITQQAIFLVNGNEINGSTFTSSTKGIFKVKAIYNGIESNEIEVAFNPPTGYSQKVLVEDYTGVWCGFCPRVAYAIQQLELQSDKIVPVAIHLHENNDPYFNIKGGELRDYFEISGLPQGRLNRTISWLSPQPDNLNQALDLTSDSAPLGIAINSQINTNTIDINIRIGFAQDYNNLGFVVYLLENGLIHDQTNYTDLFPVGQYVNPLVDFEHNEVLRDIFTDNLGDIIPNSESISDNIYLINLSKTIPNYIENQNNLELVVFVVDKNTNTVINVQHALVGEEQVFD